MLGKGCDLLDNQTYNDCHGQEVHAQEERSSHKATKETSAGYMGIGRMAAESPLISSNRTTAKIRKFNNGILQIPQ